MPRRPRRQLWRRKVVSTSTCEHATALTQCFAHPHSARATPRVHFVYRCALPPRNHPCRLSSVLHHGDHGSAMPILSLLPFTTISYILGAGVTVADAPTPLPSHLSTPYDTTTGIQHDPRCGTPPKGCVLPIPPAPASRSFAPPPFLARPVSGGWQVPHPPRADAPGPTLGEWIQKWLGGAPHKFVAPPSQYRYSTLFGGAPA